MIRKITLNVYSDPGHAWCRIPLSALKELSIADKITPYSYVRKEHAYLEEDCDLSTLIRTLKERGISYKFKEFNSYKSSKIRSYNSYNHQRIDWSVV